MLQMKKEIGVMALLCMLLVAAVPGCSHMTEAGRREAESLEQLIAYLKTVRAAASARITVRIVHADGTADISRSFPMTPAELAQLKTILMRSRPIPPSPQEPTMTPLGTRCFFNLEFLDASGRVLSAKDPSLTWTSETRMMNLPVDYQYTLFDPIWYLPDADFMTMLKMPTMRQAGKWANR